MEWRNKTSEERGVVLIGSNYRGILREERDEQPLSDCRNQIEKVLLINSNIGELENETNTALHR